MNFGWFGSSGGASSSKEYVVGRIGLCAALDRGANICDGVSEEEMTPAGQARTDHNARLQAQSTFTL